MYDNVQVIIPSLNPDEKLMKTACGMKGLYGCDPGR